MKEWDVKQFKNSPVGAWTSDFKRSRLKSPAITVGLDFLFSNLFIMVNSSWLKIEMSVFGGR